MSKRSLEGDLSEVSEAVLGDLTPNERMQLWLEAAAADNEAWIDRLRETCPTHTYRATNLAYMNRCRAAERFLQQAVYELQTTYLQYDLLDQHHLSQIWLDLKRDDDPPEAELDRAEERADEITALFVALYAGYHGYRRFATAELGVEFETWVALHPDGPAVCAIVEERLEEELRSDIADEWLQAEADATEDGADEAPESLDDMADRRYERLAAQWAEARSRVP